eukprot:4874477-Pleurochrysis_carterae.AAC.2
MGEVLISGMPNEHWEMCATVRALSPLAVPSCSSLLVPCRGALLPEPLVRLDKVGIWCRCKSFSAFSLSLPQLLLLCVLSLLTARSASHLFDELASFYAFGTWRAIREIRNLASLPMSLETRSESQIRAQRPLLSPSFCEASLVSFAHAETNACVTREEDFVRVSSQHFGADFCFELWVFYPRLFLPPETC